MSLHCSKKIIIIKITTERQEELTKKIAKDSGSAGEGGQAVVNNAVNYT